MTALMYLCPIIYTMSFLPERVQKIVMLNPLTHFLIIFRECVLYEENISIKNSWSWCVGNIYYAGNRNLCFWKETG